MANMTRVIRHCSMNAIINAATMSDKFCSRMLPRSTTKLLTNAASDAKREDTRPLLLLLSSNHPTSFRKIAETITVLHHHFKVGVQHKLGVLQPVWVSDLKMFNV